MKTRRDVPTTALPMDVGEAREGVEAGTLRRLRITRVDKLLIILTK